MKEAVSHWSICSGCTCVRDRSYPCPDCNKLITFNYNTKKSQLSDLLYSSPIGYFIIITLSAFCSTACFVTVLSLVLTSPREQWVLSTIMSICPMASAMFDARKLHQGAFYTNNLVATIGFCGLSAIFCIVSLIIAATSIGTKTVLFQVFCLLLLAGSNAVCTWRAMTNCLLLHARLNPQVANADV